MNGCSIIIEHNAKERPSKIAISLASSAGSTRQKKRKRPKNDYKTVGA
jgi:hypothetical protein